MKTIFNVLYMMNGRMVVQNLLYCKSFGKIPFTVHHIFRTKGSYIYVCMHSVYYTHMYNFRKRLKFQL